MKNPYKPGGMFEGESALIFANAKKLRNSMTDAETAIWMHLRKGINGLEIRRQHPIAAFIVDFYCHQIKLIVEIDGSVHDNADVKENDAIRQKELETLGYSFLRFINEQSLQHGEKVLDEITKETTRLRNIINQHTLPKAESKSPL